MKEIFNYTLFSIENNDITVLHLFFVVLSLAILIFLYRIAIRFFVPHIEKNLELSEKVKSKIFTNIRLLILFAIILAISISLNLDYSLALGDNYSISLRLIMSALVFWQLALAFDWVINHFFLDYFYPENSTMINDLLIKPKIERRKRKMFQYILLMYIIIYILQHFGLDLLIYPKKTALELNLSSFFEVAFTLLIAQLIVWAIVHLLLLKIYEQRNIDIGSQFAINQLIKYIVYTIAIIHALDLVGINMTIILGGAAALLVGIGLGLQQTFNDFISGLVLLFERSVSVGDVLEVEGTVGVIERIGMRSSVFHTRENVSMVVPNHLLINEKITNWSNPNDYIRFAIELSVAYGSNTNLVKNLLIKSVENNFNVLNIPTPFVRFNSFGDSSLNFTLYFFSKKFLIIEDVKSDIRLKIDTLFRENKVSIPFPQREVRLLNKD